MTTKIEQFHSKNQFIIYVPEGRYFQSYKSIIAFMANNGDVKIDEKYWNYSKTTAKYRNMFLGETTDESWAKVQNGTYELTNLN